MSVALVEQEKYQRMWAVQDYRKNSPGERSVEMFLNMVREYRTDDDTLLDAGCGTGRAGAKLAACGFDVTLTDFVDAVDVEGLPFVQAPLWDRVSDTYDFGFCCDVMEHVPPEFTMLVVARLLESCKRVFFTICTEPDEFGVRIGEPLHLTVQPFVWWRDRLRDLGTVIEARDCMTTAVFLVEARGD